MRIWKKGEYHRLSVDRDLMSWCGWQRFQQLLKQIENPLTRDLIVFAFSTMGRISEVLALKSGMFDADSNRVLVTGMPIGKRWKKIGTRIICKQCGNSAEPHETICQNCKGNLVTNSRKHFLTEKILMKRIPFWFPAREPQVPYLFERINNNDGLLFPELNRSDRSLRYGRSMAYILIRQADEQVHRLLLVPHAWNHLFVALRGHCLGEEYNMDLLEIQNFCTRVKAETVSKYVKKRLSYARKMKIEVE